MTNFLHSKRFWCLALIMILFMLTAFPSAAFADENDGSADNGQETEITGPASENPQDSDFSPPASEAPASNDFTPPDSSQADSPQIDSPQDLPAPSDSDFSGAADTNQPAENPGYEPVAAEPEMVSGTGNETDAPATGNSYIAEITPDAVVNEGTIPAGYTGYQAGEENKSFTITFTEVGDKQIGSAQVRMPALYGGSDGFNTYSFDPLTGISTSSGQSWSGTLVTEEGFTYLNLWAQSAADYLEIGQSVSATFTVTTPTLDGVYVFETKAWTTSGVDFSSDGDNFMAEGYIDPFVVVGKGVGTPTDLDDIRNNLNGYYVQTDDIDLSAFGADYDNGKGWQPIGSYTWFFSGAFNGNGFTISDLFIDRYASDIGLFCSNSGYLVNIHLTDVDITGDYSVGSLVGDNYIGSVINCYADGTVKGDTSVGGLVGQNNANITKSTSECTVIGSSESKGIGGLVGYNYDTIVNSKATGEVEGEIYVGGLVGRNESIISFCSASGKIAGTAYVGGLVGFNFWDVDETTSRITYSYATGDVEGQYQTGGLVGGNFGAISSSFASGNVNGHTDTGGLVGLNTVPYSDIPSAVIRNCYANGSVTGVNYTGGLVGRNGYDDTPDPLIGIVQNSYAVGLVSNEVNEEDEEPVFIGGLIGHSAEGSIVKNCFYDWQTSNQSENTGKGTPKTTEEMQTFSTYLNAGWDIDGVDGSYPVLGWEVDWTETIWYMGTPPDNNGDNNGNGNGNDNGDDQGDSSGGNTGGNFGTDFGFTFAPAPVLSPGGLTRIPRQDANAVITPAFVSGGSAADLSRAIMAYNHAMQNYDQNKGTMSATEKAVAVTELTIADAAIKALALSLAAQSGQAFDMAALISAYNNAVVILKANRALLTAEQIAEAEALLQAIAAVISRYST